MGTEIMRMKRETEVAIAILVACARSNGRRLKTADAAKAANTTPDFAAHIALKLVNAGFLKAKRGRSGGLELSRPADRVVLGEVICRLEEHDSLASEETALRSPRAVESDLQTIMVGARHAMHTFLDRFSIAELAG
jgi:Rrf2 family protein